MFDTVVGNRTYIYLPGGLVMEFAQDKLVGSYLNYVFLPDGRRLIKKEERWYNGEDALPFDAGSTLFVSNGRLIICEQDGFYFEQETTKHKCSKFKAFSAAVVFMHENNYYYLSAEIGATPILLHSGEIAGLSTITAATSTELYAMVNHERKVIRGGQIIPCGLFHTEHIVYKTEPHMITPIEYKSKKITSAVLACIKSQEAFYSSGDYILVSDFVIPTKTFDADTHYFHTLANYAGFTLFIIRECQFET